MLRPEPQKHCKPRAGSLCGRETGLNSQKDGQTGRQTETCAHKTAPRSLPGAGVLTDTPEPATHPGHTHSLVTSLSPSLIQTAIPSNACLPGFGATGQGALTRTSESIIGCLIAPLAVEGCGCVQRKCVWCVCVCARPPPLHSFPQSRHLLPPSGPRRFPGSKPGGRIH